MGVSFSISSGMLICLSLGDKRKWYSFPTFLRSHLVLYVPCLHMLSSVDHTFFVGAPVATTIASNECHLPSPNFALTSFPRSRREGRLRFPVGVSVGVFDIGGRAPLL